MTHYILLLVSCIFINNIILAQYLGSCPFLGTSKRIETALGMGMAVVFVLTLAGATTWLTYNWILVSYKLEFLQTIAFILIVASLVQFVEMFVKKSVPGLYASLGIFLPLITTNCAVLGVCLLNIQKDYTFVETVVSSAAYAMGFGFALILFAGILEKTALSKVPKSLQGTPISLITAGILALAFMGFKGMI